jgi:hypothetical protein
MLHCSAALVVQIQLNLDLFHSNQFEFFHIFKEFISSLIVYKPTHSFFLYLILYQLPFLFIYYFLCPCSPARAMVSSATRFLDHTQRRATVGRPPIDV